MDEEKLWERFGDFLRVDKTCIFKISAFRLKGWRFIWILNGQILNFQQFFSLKLVFKKLLKTFGKIDFSSKFWNFLSHELSPFLWLWKYFKIISLSKKSLSKFVSSFKNPWKSWKLWKLIQGWTLSLSWISYNFRKFFEVSEVFLSKYNYKYQFQQF